ncbi:Valacyclovir hydrolase, partial [Orchesella cincta]
MDIKPILSALDKEKFRWIGWDPPGYGKSRPPKRQIFPRGYSCMYELDAKYATELMKKLGIEHYSIAAWSSGGVTGMTMANRHPEQVSSMITWASYGFLGQETNKRLKSFSKLGSYALPDARRIELIEVYGEKLLHEMYSDALTEIMGMSESNVFREGGSFEDVIKNVKCPVLVIHGDKDTFIPISNAHHLNSTFQNSRLHVVKNGTHNLHLKQTHEFVKCIEGFLTAVYTQIN